VVPGGLAVGEAVGATGAQFLLAAAVGFETVIRLALASMPSLLVERGFHHTSALGVFAVALETAMLMGEDVATTVNAISIGGSHASGFTEYAQTGGEIKRVHAGISVSGGIRGARFAQLGLTAPPTAIEGKRGFLQAFCNGYDASHVTKDLGAKWHFYDRASIKIFASCALMQPHFAALDKIRAAHQFTAEDVEDVLMGCDELTLVHTGGIGPHPTDVLGAQFSSEFGMGLRLVTGRNDVGTYLDAQANGFSNPEVLAMAERVRLARDPECTFESPAGRVTLRLRDGRALSDIAFAPGSPGNPATPEDYKKKYLGLVSHDFGDEIAQTSMDMIMNIESLKDLGELTRMFETKQA
jgi:2-methylcitrate dehydratase PrpD